LCKERTQSATSPPQLGHIAKVTIPSNNSPTIQEPHKKICDYMELQHLTNEFPEIEKFLKAYN